MSKSSSSVEVQKPAWDTREYRYCMLKNGLRVLVISDNTLETDAGAELRIRCAFDTLQTGLAG